MAMTYVNLTPHNVMVRPPDGGPDRVYPPSGQLARCSQTDAPICELEGIPVLHSDVGSVTGLPEPALDTVYIVSSMVLGALPGPRADVVAPATGPNHGAIRDAAGRIVGVTRWLS